MKHKQRLISIILLIMIASLAACKVAAETQRTAKSEQSRKISIPEVTIELNDDGFTAPPEIAAGIIAVNINNTSTQYQEGGVVLGKLNEGVTYDEVTALLTGDDPAGYIKFDQMVTSLGGGDQGTIYNLSPGQYIIYFSFGEF